jgi:hypothetical protein
VAAQSRTPPIEVRRALAAEVGFGCPVEDCGSPYLTWHHFDPPWAERHHHDPAGMIALCRDHHPEADAGTFTAEQLRELKHSGRDLNRPLGARFNWMRQELVAVIGGNFFVETPIAVRIYQYPIIWFNRDANNQLLINLKMPSASPGPRIAIEDNFWLTEGADEREIVCPPSGRLVEAKYSNGDYLKIEFREIESVDAFDQRYPRSSGSHRESLAGAVQLPIAVVEITMRAPGTGIDFTPAKTALGGLTMTGNWLRDCGVGIQIGDPSAYHS